MRYGKSRIKPSKILTKALLLGLAATSYLAKARVTEETRHLYEGGKGCKGMKRIYGEALKEYYRLKRERRPSADPLQKREGSIVRSFQKIIFNTSVPYGNTEVTRKRRREDRKFINSLSDYYGAGLRNLGAEKFFFPPPMETRTDKGKTKWVYPGNATTTEYSPTHTAPELDFVDIIRSHGTELIRQCMKYSVPIGDARRYLDTLIVQLTPYLESVYTGQRKIVDGFVRGSAKVLRGLTLEIRAVYGGVTGRRQSITEQVFEKIKIWERENRNTKNKHIEKEIYFGVYFSDDINTKKTFHDSFFSYLADRCDVESNPNWRKKVRKLRTLIRKKILNRADAEYIESDLREYARQMGSSFHDFISNSEFTVKPFSLFGVYRFGDEMVNEPAEFLFTCEIYVADGKGRVDLLLFRRKKLRRVDDSRPEYMWEPCMLVEIKTRCFFDLDLHAVSTKSKDRNRRVVEHTHDLRRPTTEEWRKVIDSTPTRYEREQLDAYEKEVLDNYRKHNRQDTDPPKSLKKAVLVVDLKENWETLRDNIKELVLEAHHSSKCATLSKRQHYAFSPENKELRMGLVVFSDAESKKTNPVKSVTYFDPFSRSKDRKDGRRFTLYLTVSGKGSPAESAALVATRWHGLELIHGRAKMDNRKVVWFDLSGELVDWWWRRRVFRYVLQSRNVRRFLKRGIRFIDLSETVISHLQGKKDLKRIREYIQEHLEEVKDPVIVFTGSNRIRKTLTKKRTPQYDELVALLLDNVPNNSSVIWFDRPAPISHTSQRYDTRSVTPFYNDSIWMDHVDEVIYNVPTAPVRYGSFVPVEDDKRWMVVEHADDIRITQMLVPPLYKWGERFRPDRNRDENIPRQNMHFLRSSYSKMRGMHVGICEETDERAILELIPHLRRFYDLGPSFGEEVDETIPIRSEWLLSKPSEPKPFLSRVNYTPYQYLTEKKKDSKQNKDGRVTRLEPLEMINRRRAYRTTRLYGRPRKVTTRPPHTSLLKYKTQDLDSLYLKELSSIRRVLKTLRKRQSEDEELQGLLDTLDELVKIEKTKRTPGDTLRAVRVVIETHPLTRRIWDHLRVKRSKIPQGLLSEQEKVLKQLADRYPDILMIMGNQLFLMLSVAVYEAGVLDVTRNVIENLWGYLVPWQLVGLGYEPEYPEDCQTGRSVLHRSQLMDRLFRRVKTLKNMRVGEEVHSFQFGKAALIEEKDRTSLFLTFQTRPESRDMNTIFLRLLYGTEGQTLEVLRELCREKPFWGESDPTRLARLSDIIDVDKSVDIMVATHRGMRGLWVFDDAEQRWKAIGRLDYYQRRREAVTLLTSITLKEDSTLEDFSDERIRRGPSNLRSVIKIGLGIVSALFRNCETVKCRLSLDDEESMFRLSFLRLGGSREITHLLIKRTSDVIEVLRRPDFQCEQVVADGNEMVWNRFRDIEYVGDVSLVKPWVERREPFKSIELSLPKTADQFIKMKRRGRLKLTVRHDPRTCPLCTVSKDELRKRSESHTGDDISDYLRWIDGEKGQPEELMSESIYRHGVCWRVGLQTEEELPDAMKQLENIALSGPTLATLLESGGISYRSEKDGWALLEFAIPESEELPREFRESIHLMRWRRDAAVLPGQYIIEEWQPDISIGIDEITFSLKSQVTGAKQTHIVKKHRPDLMHPESLCDLLELEMSKLVDREEVNKDERLRGLIQELIGEIVELEGEAGPTTWIYEGLGWVTKGWFERVLEAVFTSPDGERIDIQVTQGIHFYMNWVEFSGGVDRDIVSDDVSTILAEYGIEEEVRDDVTEYVLTELEKEGIVFKEEG